MEVTDEGTCFIYELFTTKVLPLLLVCQSFIGKQDIINVSQELGSQTTPLYRSFYPCIGHKNFSNIKTTLVFNLEPSRFSMIQRIREENGKLFLLDKTSGRIFVFLLISWSRYLLSSRKDESLFDSKILCSRCVFMVITPSFLDL